MLFFDQMFMYLLVELKGSKMMTIMIKVEFRWPEN